VFQDFIEKFEQNCEDHENYADNYKSSSDWVKTAKDRLNTCKDPTGDRDAIQAKLDAVKVLDLFAVIHYNVKNAVFPIKKFGMKIYFDLGAFYFEYKPL
jgi:hypothetical protein